MKASTATRPATAATQNPREGSSPARRTANTAVQAGSSAITTAPWEESTSRSASAVSSGKPTTTPNAMMTSERHCSRVGRGACQARSTITENTAATAARPKATNIGSRSATARRVAGSENENIATPSVARNRPRSSSRRADAAIAGDAITLLELSMT